MSDDKFKSWVKKHYSSIEPGIEFLKEEGYTTVEALLLINVLENDALSSTISRANTNDNFRERIRLVIEEVKDSDLF